MPYGNAVTIAEHFIVINIIFWRILGLYLIVAGAEVERKQGEREV